MFPTALGKLGANFLIFVDGVGVGVGAGGDRKRRSVQDHWLGSRRYAARFASCSSSQFQILLIVFVGASLMEDLISSGSLL